jgi:hypothetical protein
LDGTGQVAASGSAQGANNGLRVIEQQLRKIGRRPADPASRRLFAQPRDNSFADARCLICAHGFVRSL